MLTGQRTLSSPYSSTTRCAPRYGVKTEFDEVAAIDGHAQRAAALGKVLPADRIVLAPGIEFDDMPGLTDPLAMPHAWQAGTQTSTLAAQLSAMAPGGTVVMTIPKVPYRCPPGPYERACLVADWLKARAGLKLLVLDANPTSSPSATTSRMRSTGCRQGHRVPQQRRDLESVDQGLEDAVHQPGPISGKVVNS